MSTDSPTPKEMDKRRSSVQIQGRKEISDFLIGRLLGEGAFARVFIVRVKDTGKDYAMKVMEKKFIVKEGKSKEVQMERRVLSEVSHPNVVRLYFSFHDKDRLYMILDFCVGGELAKLIRYNREKLTNRALTEEQTRFYLSETILAVQHLHSIGILHRDLKPENVLIASNGHVKITDFGTAKDLKEARKSGEGKRKDTFCGTAEYVSPEVLQDQEAGIGADIWALGIMTHSMLIGKTPFLCESEFLTFQCILTYAGVEQNDKLLDEETTSSIPQKTPENFDFPPSSTHPLSSNSLDLVKKLLNPDPNQRLGCDNPLNLRQHSFFSGLDFTKLDSITPPKLPYSTEYEAPSMDGAKQDWLMTDDVELDEFEELSTPKTSSVTQPAAGGLDKFLNPGEVVIQDGAVSLLTYGGLISARRHLVITNKARAILIDSSTLTLKEEFNVKGATVILKGNRDFEIQTSKKSLKLKDLLGSTDRWKDAIGKL